MEVMSSGDAAGSRTSSSSSSIWEEIDLAESNLVCCKFEEASSLSHSIIHRFGNTNSGLPNKDDELNDIMESAGMVFIQSQRELGRTSELITELKSLFGSVAAIPGQVFLTGVCMQITGGFSFNLKPIFEEFLGKWKYVEGNDFVFPTEEKNSTTVKRPILASEKYLDIASVYAVSLLGMEFKNVDLAISWTEKAVLPEERRQEILRKLQSLSSARKSSSSSALEIHRSADKTLKPLQGEENFSTKFDSRKNPNLETSKAVTLGYPRFSLFNQLAKIFWWVRSVRLNYGNMTLTVPPGKVLLWCSMLFAILHILRKNQTTIRRFSGEKVSSMKRALFDAWQLAFSVQVNPLAAIQPVSSNNAPGRR